MIESLVNVERRYQEIGQLLADPIVVSDYERVAGELKKGEPVVIRAWSRRSGSVTTFEIDSLSD